MPKEQELRFGPYRLQLANEQLQRGKRIIRLTPKAFAVLRYLSEHPGQLVTKDALFETIWPETIWPETVVSDVTLATYVRKVRKALGDDAQAPRFIETVHRRGYRFVAPVHTSAENEPGRQGDPVPVSRPLNNHAQTYEPDKPSIAVLPFTNLGGDPEQEYFSDGLTDTLIIAVFSDLRPLVGYGPWYHTQKPSALVWWRPSSKGP